MLTKPLICALAFTLLAIVTSGQELYNVTQQMCCDGVVHDKRRGVHCCGQDVYNSCEVGCCGDQVVDYPSELDDNYGCCLNTDDDLYTAYDSMTQKCCDGTVINLPRMDMYYQCCGTELYEFATHTCCGDVIVEDVDDMECCGDVMVTIDAGSECCGGMIIDSDTQLCCTTYEYDLKSEQSIPTSTVHEKTDDEDECCGNLLYDSDKQLCCSSYTMGKYNYNTVDKPEELADDEYAFCCGNEAITESQSCCYGSNDVLPMSYDVDTEQCCGGSVKSIYTDSDGDRVIDSCCWQSGEFYDSDTDTCTSAGVKPLSSDGGAPSMEDYCVPNQITYK